MLGWRAAPERLPSMCCRGWVVLSTSCTWKLCLLGGKHLLSASSLMGRTERCSANSSTAGKVQGLEVKSFVK